LLLEINGGALNVETSGKGKPVILIHGLGADLNLWNEVVPLLAKKQKVITYDLRGAGLSRYDSSKPLSIDLWANDLKALMDNLRVESASLVGWSLGGMISIHFSANMPERCTSLILVGTTARLRPAALEFFKRRGELASRIGMPALIDQTFQSSLDAFAPSARENRPEIIQTYRRMLEGYQKDSYAAACRALVEVDLRPKLKEISTASLIIVRQYDPRTPVEDSEAMCMAMPNSALKILPDCGHFYPLEQPKRLSQEIQRFLTMAGCTEEGQT
jgi:pimeloyl-ACP methyl ester carboxylesterase